MPISIVLTDFDPHKTTISFSHITANAGSHFFANYTTVCATNGATNVGTKCRTNLSAYFFANFFADWFT